jgi:hypothetical protein
MGYHYPSGRYPPSALTGAEVRVGRASALLQVSPNPCRGELRFSVHPEVAERGNDPNRGHDRNRFGSGSCPQTAESCSRIGHAESAVISIFDAAGRSVARLPVTPGQVDFTWDASGLAPSVYFCRLNAGGETVVTQVIKLR